MHLIENLAGMVLVAFLAFELEIGVKQFALAYVLGIAIAVPVLVAFSGDSIAGNSSGIFAVLGLTLYRARGYITEFISVPLFMAFTFAQSIFSALTCGICASLPFKSDFFHFSGFLIGNVTQFVSKPVTKRVLRGY